MTQENILSVQDPLVPLIQKGAINLGDVLLWPAPQERHKFHFLPLAPMIAQNPDGSDQVSLIDVGSMAFLQLTTHWSVPNARLEAIRSDLEAQSDDAPMILSFAPVQDVQAELFIGASSEPFATSPTSGLPPYAAMFSQQLEGEAKTIVEAGLAGQRGRIAVRYQAMLALPQSSQVTFSGVLNDNVSAAALRTALDEGRATFDVPETTQAQRDALIDQAIAVLNTMDQPDATGRFSLSLLQEVRRTEPVQVTADLGAGQSAQDLFDALLPSALGPPQD